MIFFAIVFLILGLAHWYLWCRLVRDTGLRGRARLIASLLVLGAALLLVPIWVLSLELPRDTWAWPSLVAFTWKGLLYYGVLILALFEVPRVVTFFSCRRPAPGAAVSRRQFLSRVAAGSAVVGSLSVGALGARNAFGDLATPEVPVRLPRLPRTLSGLRVAVISDVHLGPVLGEAFMRRVVDRTNALKPDLVVLTGDLVDGSVPNLTPDVGPVADLSSRYGTFFITGNHEYYSGVEQWLRHMPRLGVRVLANQRVEIGDAGGSFDLAGVHDFGARRMDTPHKPDRDGALAGRDPERELVLLAHQPAHVDEAARAGAGLQISGHTHGGQVWPFGMLTHLTQPYIFGLHEHAPGTQIYVTRGTGFWGPPLRVLAPAEITNLVLIA